MLKEEFKKDFFFQAVVECRSAIETSLEIVHEWKVMKIAFGCVGWLQKLC